MDQRALARAGDPGDDDQHAERDVDVDVLQVVGARAAHLQHPRSASAATASARRGRRGAGPVSVPLARSPSTVPSNTTSPPALPAPGPRSTTWSAIAIVSGLCSTTSTVLPLSRSRSSRSFIRWMSCGCRPDGGLVEDVGDVGQRGAELADHLDALRLAARQRARRPVAARGSRARSPRTSRGSRPAPAAAAPPTARRGRAPTPARSLICIAQASAMLIPAIFDERASSLSRVPSQSGQAAKATARSTNARMCGCSASMSLDSIDFWILGIRPS